MQVSVCKKLQCTNGYGSNMGIQATFESYREDASRRGIWILCKNGVKIKTKGQLSQEK